MSSASKDLSKYLNKLKHSYYMHDFCSILLTTHNFNPNLVVRVGHYGPLLKPAGSRDVTNQPESDINPEPEVHVIPQEKK